MDVRAYVVLDIAGRDLVWPFELHGLALSVFTRDDGGTGAFLEAIGDLSKVEGVAIVAEPTALGDLIGELKQGLPRTFEEVMKKTLVLAIQEADTGHSPLAALKRLHGFRSLTLSEWSERHIEDFIGNIFQPPAATLMAGGAGLEGLATQMADYYQLLGLRTDARHEELGAALRSYREYWSERAGEESSRAMAHYSLILIGQAESMLLDPIRRDRYDAMLGKNRSGRDSEPSAAPPQPDRADPGGDLLDRGEPELVVEAIADLEDSVDYEELVLREAMADPELTWLPGLGSRRETPDGGVWPPEDWPPEDWAPVTAGREDLDRPLDDDIAVTAAEGLDVVALEPADAPAEVQPSSDLRLDADALIELAGPCSDVAIWVAPDLEDRLTSGAGFLVGRKLGVDGKEIWIVTSALPLEAGAPGEFGLGFYVEAAGLGSNPKAAMSKLAARVGPVAEGELALVVDPTARSGRFFLAGRRPRAVSAEARVADWRIGQARRSPWRSLRWRKLAAAAIAAMALYVALPGLTASWARFRAGSVLSLAARAIPEPRGVVCSWPAGFAHVSIYRIYAEDPLAHWKLIAAVPGDRLQVLDRAPLTRPGPYRYLLVATARNGARTAISRVLGLEVPASLSAPTP